jgi:hypothetical protein
MRIQKRVKGYARRQFSTRVIKEIERAIEKECKRYGVSRSFVIANALAFTFDISVEDYAAPSKVVRFRKKQSA